MTDPIRPTDAAARILARQLLAGARHGALGSLDRATGAPLVTRVAVGLDGADPLLLISTLAQHTGNLRADPRCSLMVEAPGGKGDPMTHPRLSMICGAEAADKAALRDHWLASHPKTRLYFDFADFALVRLRVSVAHLNGGFGKAFRLSRDDLG